MKRILPLFIIYLALYIAPGVARADVTLAPLFRDGAVLQRDMPAPVWGLAEPGEKITVTFAGRKHQTTAGADGRWMIKLDPLPASATPAEMVVRGGNELRVRDILVGEVWFCSGQSNMNWPVRLSLNPEAEIAASANPLIRYFDASNETELTPQFDSPGEWLPAAPANTGDFSGVAYFFARELQPHIKMPVGIVKGTLGGSSIETWMTVETLRALPVGDKVMARHQALVDRYLAAKAAYDGQKARWDKARAIARAAGDPFDEPPPHPPSGPLQWHSTPAGLYNSNVHPFLPYAIRGFLWYQGESNAPRADEYRVLFPAMIRQWRRDFQREDAPFYFVQLANFDLRAAPRLGIDPTGRMWAFQREAQAGALGLPNTAMAVAIDAGDPKDVHPRNKQEVGRRLALIARRHAYGDTAANGESPNAVAFDIKGNEIHVRLDNTGAGIVLRGDRIQDLEMAGADRVFHPATARMAGGSLAASSKSVKNPMAVRYLWKNDPVATLFRADGLPVAPFRSDDWPDEK
jgi:sialate O-acetylesterase